ncbi:MAG: Spy/CpxP family protein refolding chaperone [Nitrospinales bacterium]
MPFIKSKNFSPYVFTLSLIALLASSPAWAEEIQVAQMMGSGGGTKIEGSKGMQMGGGMKREEGSKSKMPHGSTHGGSYSGHGKKYGHGYGKSYSAHGSMGHHGGHGHHSSPFAHVLQFKTALGLTDAQIAAINDQKFEYDKTQIKIRADLEIARMDLNRLLHSQTIDENKIRKLAVDIGGLKGQMVKSRVEAKLNVLKTLTDAQRKKVNQMYSAHP